MAAKRELRREIQRYVELAKLLRKDEAWLGADDLMAVLIAIAVNFARSRDIDWQSAFLEEAVACRCCDSRLRCSGQRG